MGRSADIARESVESFNKRDFQRYRGLLHPEYTYTGGDGIVQRGPEAGLAIAQMWAGGFPDAKIDIQRIHELGDTAVVEFIGRGTHNGEMMGIAPTGRAVTIPVCNVMEMRDGKIYAEREYMDMMHMLTQLGVVQPPVGATA